MIICMVHVNIQVLSSAPLFQATVWNLQYNTFMHRQSSDISRTLAGDKIVDHSDIVGVAPTASSFST